MRRTLAALVCASLVVLVVSACAPFRVRIDRDAEVDLSALRTFSWLPRPEDPQANPFADNPLLRKRVRTAVEDNLTSRGYRLEKDGESDFQVVFHVTLANKTIRQTGPGFVGYPYYAGYARTYEYSFQEGTLILDVVSQDGKALLWRGWVTGAVPTPDTAGNRVALAVREILKRPSHFDQVDAIVAADSVYAGLQQKQPERQVDEQQMRDFLRFASLAVHKKKTFVISHSTQPTPYASTTETADYLQRWLRIPRKPGSYIWTKTMRQLSQASRGRFFVLGFDGESGKDHMQDLHNIDLLWKRLSDGNQ